MSGTHQFHNASLLSAATNSYTDTKFTYDFQNFFHPAVGDLIQRLNRGSVRDMLDPAFLAGLSDDFFAQAYTVYSSAVLEVRHHPKGIDLQAGGPYGNYNWELLFHFPLAIAVHLSKQQRFSDAQRWFHYIFDPTCNDTAVPAPQRYWKFLAFRENHELETIADLLPLLSKPDALCTPAEIGQKLRIRQGYAAISNNPFQPHPVARTRTVAYQLYVVMKYLDNLIEWGDSLFQEDTSESINDATMRYILAGDVLGPRPESVPACRPRRSMCFADLKAAPGGMDDLGNAMVAMETQFPFNVATAQASSNATGPDAGGTFGIGRALYFCIPHNKKLLDYWDRVAGRLYNIRNCLNIDGVARKLELFDPVIDPRMLMKAAAAGISVGDVLGGTDRAISPLRAQLLIQKALELCGEVRSLGGSLLTAIEKKETEAFSMLRQGHELKIQQLAQDIRFLQWKQNQESTRSLLRSRASALERYSFYLRLLGQTPDGATAPAELPLDRRTLTEENFDEAYGELIGQYEKTIALQPYATLKLSGAGAPPELAGSSNGRLYLTGNEDLELNKLMPLARDVRMSSAIGDTVASVVTFISEFKIDLSYWGLGADTKIFGGSKLSSAIKLASEVLRTTAAYAQDQAGMAARTAGYERRGDEWLMQANLGALELMQIGRQILGSLIAEQVAHHEYLSAKAQIENAQEADAFLRSKFTNVEFYSWLEGETSRLYFQYYRLAVSFARKAERAMKRELMRPELDEMEFIQPSYGDGGRSGLLSGEALLLDVKRMELAYHDYNIREFEMTRHFSLRRLDPVELLKFKTEGKCVVSLPEWLFDRDCPGHYMRRLKSVAVSIPSVVGPYTSLNCTLSLLRSAIRTSTSVTDGYARTGADDERFVDYFGQVQSIVTSGGSADSGLFEANLNDSRFLPFEGSGAISTWSLALPEDLRGFDYATISDVILHVRYTARQGGESLGAPATAALNEMFADEAGSDMVLLLSVKSDHPTEWAAHVNANTPGPLTLNLMKASLPYMAQDMTVTVGTPRLWRLSGGLLTAPTAQVQPPLNPEIGVSGLDLTIPAAALAGGPSAQFFIVVPYIMEGI